MINIFFFFKRHHQQYNILILEIIIIILDLHTIFQIFRTEIANYNFFKLHDLWKSLLGSSSPED